MIKMSKLVHYLFQCKVNWEGKFQEQNLPPLVSLMKTNGSQLRICKYTESLLVMMLYDYVFDF